MNFPRNTQIIACTLSGLLLLLTLFPAHLAASAVTLAWDLNTEDDLAGYKVYYGIASRDYDSVIDVGNITSYTVTDLEPETQYYFALTAYDTSGNESDFSAEVSASTSNDLSNNLTVDFGSMGLWQYDNGWSQLTTSNPSLLGAYSNKLVVEFSSGLYEYDGSWTRIASSDCEDMAGIGTDLYADFGTLGLWKYNGSWAKVATNNPSLLGSYGNKLVVAFYSGLYEYDGSWTKIASSDCEDMAGVGTELYVDFGSVGLWKYGSGWTKVAGSNIEDMTAVDLN